MIAIFNTPKLNSLQSTMYTKICRQHAINVLLRTRTKNLEDIVVLFKKLLHSRVLYKIVNNLIDVTGYKYMRNLSKS